MTDPGTAAPTPDTSSTQRRKYIAIGINVVLLLAVIGAVVVNAGGDDDASVATAASTTTEPGSDRKVDESDAFVAGIQRQPTTTSTTSTTIPDRDRAVPPGSTVPATSTTTTTTTTTPPDEPPVLSGELDEDGIPVGLEFPLFNSQHTIIGGENLWLIAANQLAAITDRSLDEVPQPDIARYWERVIETNRADLRSGDPNLVYPGEVITFPGA